MTEEVTEFWPSHVLHGFTNTCTQINWTCNFSSQICSFSITPLFCFFYCFSWKALLKTVLKILPIIPAFGRRQGDQKHNLASENPKYTLHPRRKTSAKTQTECTFKLHLLSLDKRVITAEVRQDLWVLYIILRIPSLLQSQVFTVPGPVESGTIPSSPSTRLSSEQTAVLSCPHKDSSL